MHEWALAETVVETLARKAKEFGISRFSTVKIILGKLQQIDRDILHYALNELLKMVKNDLGITVDSIVFEEEDVVLQCSRCGYQWKPDLDILGDHVKESVHFIPETVHVYVSCPQCNSHDFNIVSGRGIGIEIG